MSTTFEALYKPALDEYREKYLKQFGYRFPAVDPNDGVALKRSLVMLSSFKSKIGEQRPPAFTFDFAKAIDEQVAPVKVQYDSLIAAAEARYKEEKMQLYAQHQSAVQAAEAKSEASVSDLTKAYDELLTYKDKIKDAVLRYDIKPSDIDIDSDSLTRSDMEALVATALEACKHISDSKSRNRLALLYSPPEDDHDTRLYHAIGVLILLVLAAPVVFFGIIGYTAINLMSIYKYVDGLRIADKLMYGINFQRFRDEPELESIPDVDLTEIEAARVERLEKAEKLNPETRKAQLNAQLTANMERINSDIDEANREVMQAYAAYSKHILTLCAEVEKAYNTFMENRVSFDSVCSDKFTMNYECVLGLADETIEVKYPVLEKNIVFANRDPAMIDFQRLLLANILLNVRPHQLSITLYDPEGLGAAYTTFLGDETKKDIFIETKDMEGIIDKHRAYAQTNLRILDTLDINAFNADAESKGKVTREYKLLFIVTPDESLYKKAPFIQFIKTSVRAGVHVWMVGPTPIEGCTFYAQPFEGVDQPYPVTQEMVSNCVRSWVKMANTMKDTGILYVPAFQEKYLPEDKWWQENCDKGIKLNLGLQEGDPSKGYDIMLSDMPVHGLCGGATGAGKSAFINQLLASLTTRYPPSALELILIDFKNVEFGSLADGKTHLSRIPHARILSGTKDGEYAVSIFQYLLTHMEWRNTVFTAAGTKKLEDYNKKMRGAGTPEKCLPRVLLLIDEFQVMFSLDPKVVETIQKLIQQLSKLARSAGVHMLFTSQSMTGTMSKDVKDQFSLRIALRCSAETSEELLGSRISSTIKAKFGYLYSNTNAGSTQDSTVMWRSPFIDDHIWFSTEKMEKRIADGKEPAGSLCILDKLANMCEQYGEHHYHAYFYDSAEVWYDKTLLDWLKEHRDVVMQNPGLVVAGERMAYSVNNAPVNFRIRRSDGENLLVYAFDDKDLCNMILTLVDNLTQDSNNIILMNSADADYHRILGISDIIPENYENISHPNMDPKPWLEFLTNTIAKRKMEGMEGKKPVYFFAVRWDKQMGVYRGDAYKTQEMWKSILQDGPSVDVHIILCTQGYKEIQAGQVALFNHKMVGQGPGDAGYRFLESQKNAKLYENGDSPAAIYAFGQDTTKFKIYHHQFKGTFESRELVL